MFIYIATTSILSPHIACNFGLAKYSPPKNTISFVFSGWYAALYTLFSVTFARLTTFKFCSLSLNSFTSASSLSLSPSNNQSVGFPVRLGCGVCFRSSNSGFRVSMSSGSASATMETRSRLWWRGLLASRRRSSSTSRASSSSLWRFLTSA